MIQVVSTMPSIDVGATLTAASKGFAIVPSADASSTRHDQASQPMPWLAMRREFFTSCSTSNTGFFVCTYLAACECQLTLSVWRRSYQNKEGRSSMLTFSRKMSVRSGMDSSLGGSRPPGIEKGSLLGAEPLAMSLSIGVNSTAMRALGPCLPSYTGHVSTVSAVVLAAGIAKKSFDGSVVYMTLDCRGRSGLLYWS